MGGIDKKDCSESNPRQKWESLSKKKKKTKGKKVLGAWLKWYSVQHLPSKHKVLNSNHSTEK
jgi:hypothetical protein